MSLLSVYYKYLGPRPRTPRGRPTDPRSRSDLPPVRAVEVAVVRRVRAPAVRRRRNMAW